MKALENAKFWSENAYFDLKTREEAAALMQNETALLSSFGAELHFGTGGLRGIVGVGCARMNRYTVARATLGLARSLKQRGGKAGVVIAHDSRHGWDEFTAVTAGVFAAEGVHVYVFDTLVPTPMLSFAVRELKLDVGASSFWSEITSIQTLDNLLMQDRISLEDYLERIPEGYVSRKQELIDKIKGDGTDVPAHNDTGQTEVRRPR